MLFEWIVDPGTGAIDAYGRTGQHKTFTSGEQVPLPRNLTESSIAADDIFAGIVQ
jgi:hypothetical protein